MYVLNGLKDSDRDMRTWKMIQIVGSCQLLKIQEHLQKFMDWWPEEHLHEVSSTLSWMSGGAQNHSL
jgi:hypothetical protein